MEELMLEKSIIGKLPISEEKAKAKEIYDHLSEAVARIELPFVVFDKEKVVWHLKEAKRKLEELGV